jgi:acetylglutamate kinase
VNADTVASAIAARADASELLLVTDSGGVRRHPDSVESTVDRLDRTLFEEGISSGWIRAGMRVKIEVALAALQSGIPSVHILAIDDLVHRRSGTRIV